MTNKLINTPGYAYVTEDKGCKLSFGQKIYIKYFTPDGRYAITNKGKYEAMRFSPYLPSLDAFNFPLSGITVNNKKEQVIKSYKDLYYELVRDGRDAYMRGSYESFCKKLFNYY